MTLDRNRDHWPDEARHQFHERIAMRLENVTRPLTRDEQAKIDAWAEEQVRIAWRAL